MAHSGPVEVRPVDDSPNAGTREVQSPRRRCGDRKQYLRGTQWARCLNVYTVVAPLIQPEGIQHMRLYRQVLPSLEGRRLARHVGFADADPIGD